MTKPWYKEGLNFACTGCGKCCTGEPGYVWIDQEEIEAMAEALGITVKEFIQTYTRQVDGELSLKEYPRTYQCIFLRDNMCMVYKARPKQCRTFPFWQENLESKEAWENCAKRCEGINHETAPTIPLSSILKSLHYSEEDFANSRSARQSEIDSTEEHHSQIGKGDEEN